jgi:polyisoprenoid-binding protein YceI
MKRISFLMLSGLFLSVSCTQAPKSDEAKITTPKEESKTSTGETYTADLTASKIEWIGTKVSGYHTGTINLKSGELTVADGQVTGGKFTMDMTSIKAIGPDNVPADASKKLTGHLQSGDFFDTQKFPEATFVITGIKPYTGKVTEADDPRQEKLNEYKVPNPSHMVSGNLTIKGIEKNIEFPALITVNGNTAEARAKFNVDRKQWGIVFTGKPDDLVRDEFHLGIYLKANK